MFPYMRKGRDSNSRTPLGGVAGLANLWFKPLTHPSVVLINMSKNCCSFLSDDVIYISKYRAKLSVQIYKKYFICTNFLWWRTDLNRRHQALQARALPTELPHLISINFVLPEGLEPSLKVPWTFVLSITPRKQILCQTFILSQMAFSYLSYKRYSIFSVCR